MRIIIKGKQAGQFFGLPVLENMEKCRLCPRNCNIDRNEKAGYCGVGDKIKIGRAAPHYWEEPFISGERGSGTVFFSGCSLRCVFCQNKKISGGELGRTVSVEELAEIYLSLEASGVHNVNLVTATHYTDKVAESIVLAKKRGCKLPFLWNSSGYEHVETMKRLDGLIDIYLPDMKYHSSEISKKYSNCPDYFEVTKKAISEMRRQTGTLFVKNGLLKFGTVVRHLVLPTYTEDSKKIIEYLYSTYGDSIYISIMSQYVPFGSVPDELNRRITEDEYNEVVDFAMSLGVKNAFIQERESAAESFIPDFFE